MVRASDGNDTYTDQDLRKKLSDFSSKQRKQVSTLA